MKNYKLYNKKGLFAGLLAVCIFSSCIKNYRPGETVFSNLQPIVLIPEGGLAAFGAQALNYPASDETDTFYFRINFAATNVAPADEKVTFAVDPAALTAYNANGGVQYQAFPDSIFSFTATEATVKAGQNYSDPIAVAVHPSKVDPTKNYMLPISIKSAPAGSAISGNFGTLYLHFIGNPIAGTYNVTGTRYNYTGTVSWDGNPSSVPVPGYVATTNLAGTKTGAPDDTQTIQIPFANVGAGYNYILTWDGNPAHTLSIDYTFTSVYSNFQPVLVNFTPPDATHKASFHIITHYNNALAGAGNDRIIDETFTHQ